MKIWSGVWLPKEDIDEDELAQLAQILPSTDRPFNRIKIITVRVSTTNASSASEPSRVQRGARGGKKRARDVAPQNEELAAAQDEASGSQTKRTRRNPARSTRRK